MSVLDWERINETTERLQVHGGWLVRSKDMTNRGSMAMAQSFVSDADHEWELPKRQTGFNR